MAGGVHLVSRWRILNRTPDPDGYQFWLNYYQQQTAAGVAAGTIKQQIARGFFDSPQAYGFSVHEADWRSDGIRPLFNAAVRR